VSGVTKNPGRTFPGLLCLFVSLRDYVRISPELETHQALRSRLVRRDIVKLVVMFQFSTISPLKDLLQSSRYVVIL